MADKTYTEDGSAVWMHNPETNGVWACPVGYAQVAEARGWVYSEPVDDSLVGLFDHQEAPGLPGALLEGGAVQTGYNPDEHTVVEVNEYLDNLDPEGPEYAQILDRERAGQARKTITGD